VGGKTESMLRAQCIITKIVVCVLLCLLGLGLCCSQNQKVSRVGMSGELHQPLK